MEVMIKVCDICNRDLKMVDSAKFSGCGTLKFSYNLGGSLRTSSTINFDDLCCECTQDIKATLDKYAEISKTSKRIIK